MKLPGSRVREPIPIRKPQNEYYESLSERFGIAQVILYMGLLAFVVLSFLSNTNLITYQNLYLFFKDLNHSMEAVDVFDTDVLVYPSSEEQSFTLYRNGLAVAGDTSVTVFTATGRQTLTQSISYRTPIAVGNGKYLLVYDLGGKKYSVYNSYTQLYAGTTEYPITYATVSDEGMYLLVSSSAQATSVAELYSDSFHLLNRFSSKNGYYTSGAIAENGDVVALLSSTADTTAFATQLTVCSVGANEASVSRTVADALGLDCNITPSGEIIVLCSDRILFLKKNGDVLAEESFSKDSLLCYDLHADGAALCLKNDASDETARILLFDKRGNPLYNEATDHAAQQIERSGDMLFLLSQKHVVRIDYRRNLQSSQPIPWDSATMIAVKEDEILLCTKKKAAYLSFS